jgi:predicted regulator of Ras-like GTPase activity (Roadblock/LC7/MglB family)
MSSVQPPPESASRAGRLDRILRDLLHQTPGVEAAAVVSFDGLPMASALPSGMDEDRVAAMSAALLSLAERAAQGLGRGDLSQVYIEGEHGTVFLVSAQDEGVLVAVTSAGAKVGMMLYEVKLAANRVGEVLHGPTPLPAPLPTHVTRGYLDAQDRAVAPAYAEPVQAAYAEPVQAAYAEPVYAQPAQPAYLEPAYAEPVQTAYAEPAYYAETPAPQAYAEPAPATYAEPAVAPLPLEPAPWSSYAPTGSVLPGEQGSWS